MSENATPEETHLALRKIQKNVFDTAKANTSISNRAMKSKEDMAVSHQLIEINKEYNSQRDQISPQYSSTAIKKLDKLVTIPHFVSHALSVCYFLSLKENKGWLPKEFGLIPSDSLKLKLLSDFLLQLHTLHGFKYI